MREPLLFDQQMVPEASQQNPKMTPGVSKMSPKAPKSYLQAYQMSPQAAETLPPDLNNEPQDS